MEKVFYEETAKGHSPLGSVKGALQWVPYVDVEVGDRDQEGVDEGVEGGVQDGVRRGVGEVVRIPRLGVAREVPALGQQAKEEEEEEGKGTHGTDLLHLGFGNFVFI